MKVTTTPTSSTPASNQDDAIQAAVDEQLFRELNATIPPEFRDDGDKSAATPGLSALEAAEKQVQIVLEKRPATSTDSSMVSTKVGAKGARTRKKGAASKRDDEGGDEA